MKRLSLILLTVGILFSCENEPPSSLDSSDRDPLIVNLDQALLIAERADPYITGKDGLVPASNARVSPTRKVSSSFSVKPGTQAPSYYIINYESGGFAIISGDRRVMPILAFSDKNSFPTDAESYPSAVVHWLEGAHLEVQEARLKNIEQTPLVKAAWNTFDKSYGQLNARSSYGDDDPAPDPRCYSDGALILHSITTVGPLTQTTWGQGDGYNDQCPYLACPGYFNGRAPTGCVATAAAQIMRYHSHPATYPWSSMINNLPTSSTASVMKDIGVAVTMAYTCDGSGVVLSNAATALTGSFGYSTASYGDYNYATVLNEINLFNRPVILGGGRNSGWWIFGVFADGHAWVCDGTRQTEYYSCYLQDGNLYSTAHSGYLDLHMNWGWNGSYNGFYSINNFNPSTHTFNYKTTQIVHIKP